MRYFKSTGTLSQHYYGDDPSFPGDQTGLNLGDSKSLITHPATTTHKNLTDEARAELGISAGTVRFSAGIEDSEDLLEDFARALAKVGA